MRFLSIAAMIVLFAGAALADEGEIDAGDPGQENRAIGWGLYAAAAAGATTWDAGRLAAAAPGQEPFDLFGPMLEGEVHAFLPGVFLIGFSGGWREAGSDGSSMDIELASWDAQIDLGTEFFARRRGADEYAVGMVTGLGYGENRARLDGNFGLLTIDDPELPRGEGDVTLTQQAFVADVAIRLDHRKAYGGGATRFLLVDGFSLGAKFTAAGPWRKAGNAVDDLPDVNTFAFFARIHIGPGLAFDMPEWAVVEELRSEYR